MGPPGLGDEPEGLINPVFNFNFFFDKLTLNEKTYFEMGRLVSALSYFEARVWWNWKMAEQAVFWR